MPKLVFIIRHGEKPADSVHLAPKGHQRADALAALFDSKRNGGAYPTIDALFAAASNKGSHRPVATLKPLARACDLPLDERYTEKDHGQLAAVLRGKSYDRKVVLICWRHGQIPALTTALGAGEVPEKWPAERFDLVWRLDYGSPGASRFDILPQLLLYGDQPP